MIRVNKSPPPVSIQDGSPLKVKYLQEYQNWESSGKQGEKPNPKYNQRDVKLTLMSDFNSKCGYCEKKFNRRNFDIEHYKPKSDFPKEALNWDNLLLACKPCNMEKSNRFFEKDENPQVPPINPCIDDPKKFFTYKMDKDVQTGKKLVFILPKDGLDIDEKRAVKTIDYCDLNRDEMLEYRARAISDATSHKIMEESGVGGDYHIRYITNQKDEEYLGALQFFKLLS